MHIIAGACNDMAKSLLLTRWHWVECMPMPQCGYC